MYNVHTQIGRYELVHTAKSLSDAKTAKQYIINTSSDTYPIAYITDANGERI